MKKKYIFLILALVLFLGFSIYIKAKKEEDKSLLNLNLFIGETSEILLTKNNINQENDLLNINHKGCEQGVCIYKIEAIKTGETVIKDDEMYEYHINIKDYNDSAKQSGLSKDEIYDIKIFELLQSFSISSMLEIENLSEDERDDLFNKIEIIKQETFPENDYSK